MARKTLLYGGLLAALVAIVAWQFQQPAPPPREYVRGRNGTVLFLINEHNGLSNVHMATASSFLELFPDIEVHIASFPRAKPKVDRIVKHAKSKNPKAPTITFHQLEGRSYSEALNFTTDDQIIPPGMTGIREFCLKMQRFLAPWDVDEHFALYQQLHKIVAEVDPAVVAIDTVLLPAIEATRALNRVHTFISPNTALDVFFPEQPNGGMLWKYPAYASGHPFPVPWDLVPANVYLTVRWIYTILFMPSVAEKRKELEARGIDHPIDFTGMPRSDVPWLTQTLDGAAIPLDYLPPNVTSTGPILLSSEPAEEQDPKLVKWLKQKPTILVSLGSTTKYNEERATKMAQAIANFLANTEHQVLWKLIPESDISMDFIKDTPAQQYVKSGRLQVTKWLTADQAAVLESGHLAAYMHHGGASSYHEAIAGGTPQIVMPLWADLYNFAALVEDLGVGVWGCPKTSPSWTVDCLTEAMIAVTTGPRSAEIQQAAKRLGDVAREKGPGRHIAAREISKLAYSGRA